MKLKLQLIFASILLVSACALFSSCHHDDWYADDNVLTDASHGSLTNHHVVATGEARDVTHNSATILFSANYNYKESLGIKPIIIYSDTYEKSYSDSRLDENDKYASRVEINNFTSSECQVTLTDLRPSTTYYYRVYWYKNSWNSHYGEVKSFKTDFDSSIIDAVDLGLSVKWANMNIGATHPEDNGDRFYWGGIEACENAYQATWHNFSLSTLRDRGYIDENGNLCSSYDAATQQWGSKWRMPTKEECEELVNKCSWTYTRKNSKEVFKVTGPNGNIIYLPFIPEHWSSTSDYGTSSYYLFASYNSYYYRLNKYTTSEDRQYLNAIRPVLKN